VVGIGSELADELRELTSSLGEGTDILEGSRYRLVCDVVYVHFGSHVYVFLAGHDVFAAAIGGPTLSDL
jgi:hypothetical protein